MTMQFWQLDSPDYDSDYRHTYINGSIEHPFALPGVHCDVCGATYGGSRIFAHECPQEFRQHNNILEGWPISRVDHANLQREMMAALGIRGEPFVDLQPGDTFQPCYLDVPSKPSADFLWSCLGSLVVSNRIRDLLLEFCPADIAVCPVILRKIGTRSARLSPPMPSTGESADIINEVPLLADTTTVENYSEILILNHSGFPPGGEPISVCSGCKREEFGKHRELRMTPEMWKGQAIFFLETTLYVIVTDQLRKAIERHRPTNAVFKPI